MTDPTAARGRQLAESGIYSPHNGSEPDWPGEPPPDEPPADDGDQCDNETEPTTWEPIDLGPYLRGEVEHPEPACGAARSDGLRLVYPGREHAILGETESGKTWFALMCVAAELAADNAVVYVHYEESDPASTIERLRLLQVPATAIAERLRFVAPHRPARAEWVAVLLNPVPTLVVHDGVNEAMALHGADIMAAEGASVFRRRMVSPFIRAGSAVISCDHLPKNSDGRSRDAYGSVHKGNALDGARIVLENVAPFGRQMRGVSHVFITKDRPGQLRTCGKPSKIPGKTFMGTLVVDDTQPEGPDTIAAFYAPTADEAAPETGPAEELAGTVWQVIHALPEHTVPSLRRLYAELRSAEVNFRESKARDAVDDLIVAGRVIEVRGKNRACGYRTVSSAAQAPTDSGGCSGAAVGAAPGAALIEGGHRAALTRQVQPSARAAPGSTGQHRAALK